MPVVVTGADQPIGRAVALALVGQGLDLRATVDSREAVTKLVGHGVKTAVSDMADAEGFGAVLDGAHTVIHVRNAPADALLGIADLLLAADDSGLRRVVTIAPIGRLGTGEQAALDAMRDSDYDVVVLRVAAVAEVGLARPDVRRVAPIALDDLAAACIAADRLRDLGGYTELDAVGPDIMSAADFTNGPLGRLVARLRPGQDLVGDGGAGLAAVLGVVPRSPVRR